MISACPKGFANVVANAIVPDQLVHYVMAVSGGLEPKMFGNCIGYVADDGDNVSVVLIGYLHDNEKNNLSLDIAIDEVFKLPKLSKITVLSSVKPTRAPLDAIVNEDYYWSLPLPLHKLNQKLRNMLTRADRDIIVKQSINSGWSNEHLKIVTEFCSKHDLDDGSVYIFNHLKEYLNSSNDVILFSAYDKKDNLIAFAIGDFSSFTTAFYMFAFRSVNAIPGTADKLLHLIILEATKRGHVQVNLGLGINSGVTFFKKKWESGILLPYIETTWEIKTVSKKGWFASLFGG